MAAVQAVMDFDLAELLVEYIQVVRDPDTPLKEKLAYGKEITALMQKIQEYNGLVVKAKESRETTDENGQPIRKSVETSFLGNLTTFNQPPSDLPKSRFIRPREKE